MKKLILLLISLALQAQENIECKNEEDKKGECIERWFYEGSKRIWREATYKNGELDGVERWYYKSGALDLEVPYKRGKIDGVERDYFESGKLRRESVYREGRVEGSEKFYYENGNLEGEILYKNGKKEGISKRYKKDKSPWLSVVFSNDESISGECRAKPLSKSQLHRIKKDSLLSSLRKICP